MTANVFTVDTHAPFDADHLPQEVTDFLVWLSRGLLSGEIPANGLTDAVHSLPASSLLIQVCVVHQYLLQKHMPPSRGSIASFLAVLRRSGVTVSKQNCLFHRYRVCNSKNNKSAEIIGFLIPASAVGWLEIPAFNHLTLLPLPIESSGQIRSSSESAHERCQFPQNPAIPNS